MFATWSADPTARTIEDQFLELIWNDADLLAAEFDAIIAAEWPGPPPDSPAHGAAGGHLGDGPPHAGTECVGDPIRRPRHPGIAGRARQRSPPLRGPTDDKQKGR